MLSINFQDEDLFISEKGIQILTKDRVLTRELVRQQPSNAQNIIDTMNTIGETSHVSTMAILVTDILLGAGLQQVFGMISAL